MVMTLRSICGRKQKESFAKHGGQLKNEQKPKRHTARRQKPAHSVAEVVFVREDRTERPTATYRTYRAPDAASAKEFLDSPTVTRLTSEQFYYVVVETPDGTYGRDISGYNKE